MKPFITTLFIAVLFILQPGSAFSQKNMQPGYIINLQGDTVKGSIEVHNWINNPTEILFIETNSGKATTYKPIELKRFGTGNDTYVTAIVNLDKSSVNIGELGYAKELETSTDTLLLRVLFGGNKNLYYHKEKNSPEQFFIDGKEGITWLTHKAYLKEVAGATMEEKNDTYRRQLQEYMADCPSVQTKLAYVEYQQKAITRLFRDYYTCKNQRVSYEEKIEKVHFEAGILAGYSISNFKFSSTYFGYLANADFKSSSAPSGGVFVNIIFPKKFKQFSLCNEVIYNSYKAEAGYTETNSAQDYVVNNTKIGFSYVKLNTMIRYTIPVSRIAFFINAGVSNGLIVSSTNYRKSETYYYSPTPVVKEEKALSSLRNHEQSFVAGAGVKVSRFSFEARYENGNGMSAFSYLGAAVKRLYFFAGFRF